MPKACLILQGNLSMYKELVSIQIKMCTDEGDQTWDSKVFIWLIFQNYSKSSTFLVSELCAYCFPTQNKFNVGATNQKGSHFTWGKMDQNNLLWISCTTRKLLWNHKGGRVQITYTTLNLWKSRIKVQSHSKLSSETHSS